MADIVCSKCDGKGQVLVPRGTTDGQTKYVLESCGDCGGQGRIRN